MDIFLENLNEELEINEYLLGDNIILADIVLACHLIPYYRHYLDAGMRE